jgi:hypothetical protein
MPQITSITSEALQATIRRLLPSQVGFGDDLQATNLITPIIDLTPTAEGSEVRADLQTALAFASNTPFDLNNATSTVVSTTGFFRITGCATVEGSGSGDQAGSIAMTDGATTKILWQLRTGPTALGYSEGFDLVFFVNAGESISIAAGGNVTVAGS